MKKDEEEPPTLRSAGKEKGARKHPWHDVSDLSLPEVDERIRRTGCCLPECLYNP